MRRDGSEKRGLVTAESKRRVRRTILVSENKFKIITHAGPFSCPCLFTVLRGLVSRE